MAKVVVQRQEVKITLELSLAEAKGLASLFNHIAGGVVDANDLGDIYRALDEVQEIGEIGSLPRLQNLDPHKDYLGWVR